MHVVVWFRICAVFSINQMAFSEESVIYCNEQKLEWRDAMYRCIDAGGTPVGKYMLRNGFQTDDQRYWTSDFYTRQNVNTVERADFCGYRRYSQSTGFGTENFRNCSDVLFYLCCTGGQTLRPNCLHNGTWTEATTCKQTFGSNALWNFPIGAYWTRTAIELIQHNIPANQPSYYQVPDIYQCGVINTGGTFQYTRNCNQVLPSYCNFVSRGALWQVPAYMRVCSNPHSSHLTTRLRPVWPTLILQTTTSQSTTSKRTISQTQTSQITASQRTAITNLISKYFQMTTEQYYYNTKSTRDSYPSTITPMRSSFNAFSKVNSIIPWQVVTTKGQHILTQILNANAGLSTATQEGRHEATRQYKTTQTGSGWIIGVTVCVGIIVALTTVIGLILMRRRGVICRPPSKETEAHVNATYGVANGDVSLTLPVVSTFENVHAHPDNGDDNSQNLHHIYARTNMAFPDIRCQHENDRIEAVENALYGIQTENNRKSMDYQDVKHRRQNESGPTNNLYSRVNKPSPFNKNKDSKATQSNEKTRLQTAHDNQRAAKGTTTTAYDNASFKDSRKQVQRNDYASPHEETDEYDNTCLRNIHLHHDSDYDTLEENDDYTMANIRGNKTPKLAINVADDCTYNTPSNRNEDYNTVNLHRDNLPSETLPSDETYNALSDETDDYNVVDFNGECTLQVTIHQDDTYNTLRRRTEEYNTVNFLNNTNETEDCYDHLH